MKIKNVKIINLSSNINLDIVKNKRAKNWDFRNNEFYTWIFAVGLKKMAKINS